MNGSERDGRRHRSPRDSALTRSASLAAVVLAAALALAACGGSGSPSSVKTSSRATVKTASESGVGTVLTNSAGRTLYLFKPDNQQKPTCTGSCAKLWRVLELSSGKPVAGSGVKSSLLGTVKFGGHTVVTYNHWPLYTFSGDSGPKQNHGEGLYGKWYVVNTSGNAVAHHKKASGSSGGYGY